MKKIPAGSGVHFRAHLCVLLVASVLAVAGCGGGKSQGDASGQASSSSPADGSSGSSSPPAPSPGASSPGTAVALSYTPLSWPQQDPTTQYTLADGTLVTQIGGRVRDRHAREQPDSPGTGDPYDLFAPHYFERRTLASLAAEENKQESALRMRLLRIRETLRACIEQAVGEGRP